MSFYCGIDLGTTNSTLSVIDIARRSDKPMQKLKTIPIYQFDKDFNGINKSLTSLPSYLFFDVDKNRVYTGEYAKDIYVHGDRPLQTVTAVKTRIGTDSVVEIPSIATDKKEQFDILADAYQFSDEDLRRRRSESVKNVKKTNGRISLEQRGRGAWEEDDEWQD